MFANLAQLGLYAGLFALFAALVVTMLALAGGSVGRTGVARSLALVDRVYKPGAASRQDEAFRDRVAIPFARRLGALGWALTPAGAIARLERWLDYAGNPPAWPITRLVQLKGTLLVGVALLGALLGLLYGGLLGAGLGVVIGAVLGFFAPDLAVLNTAQKRQQEIRKSLPDILDMLTVSVEAGLGFDAALAQVATGGKGPMAGETARMLAEMQIGKSRVEALRSMGERTKVAELRVFTGAVVQASELGIPIANVLREQASEMRLRRRQRAEELAQKIPIKILFPVIFFLFPALFVVVIGPGAINIIKAFSAAG